MSSPDAPRRVFVALMLGPELGEAVAREVSAALADGDPLRTPRPEGLHATLAFLGDTPAPAVERVDAELARALAAARAPALRLTGAGAFPARGRERVLWIGVSSADALLEELRRRVWRAVDAAGLECPEERARPFRPHVTVGRPRGRLRQGSVPAAFYDLALDLPWTPGEAALVESVAVPRGPRRYEPLRRYPLVG